MMGSARDNLNPSFAAIFSKQQQQCTTIPVLLQLFVFIKPCEKHYPLCPKKTSIHKKLDQEDPVASNNSIAKL
jgi:hypothetical protein